MTPMTPIISWDTGGLFYLSRKNKTLFFLHKNKHVFFEDERRNDTKIRRKTS